MLVSVVAAVVGTAFFGPPQTAGPEDIDAKGFALVFAERPADGFELFYKEQGKTWEDVPAAQTAALERSHNPWIVFNFNSESSDFGLKIGLTKSAPSVDSKLSSDFSGYFRNDAGTVDASNNYGLHDIY